MLKFVGKMLAGLGGDSSAGQSFHPSQTCPECGTKLMRTSANAEWHCPNLDCPAQIRARMEHWCSAEALNIVGCDAALVAKLVVKGLLRDVAEIYRLKVGEIASIEGMDKDSAQRLFDAITDSQKREGWRALFGLSIPHLTAAEAISLSRHFGSVDNVFAASADRLLQAERVSAETARSIVQWHSDGVNRKLVKRLFKAGVNFKADVPQNAKKQQPT